jgi:hypothetical protein
MGGHNVPRYFLHLRYPAPINGYAQDDEGDELPDPSQLREHVLETARDLIRHARMSTIPNWFVCTFEVTDEAGDTVLILPFTEAVE